ncbi:cobalt/nickel transport system permease protein [Rhizobium sp. SG_E_25_P2]|uniref:energy-coupling factor transporter transmembrane component T family protein n=1 Tax=Rhizobium sp. SG_E_25_P2 TaxID=2879942 RepID=UPI002476BEEE|nr:CbiQ family ECF transporter T component [Rhizobium sp. SG_E_25_P2]MDH6269555.1 cobalt/nickel transport system permease protein [Rhizobium sp. SG_E_25_P2]
MRAIDRCAQTNRWRRHAAGEKLLWALGVLAVSLTTAGWVGQIAILSSMLALLSIGARIPWRDIAKAARIPFLFIATGTAAQLVSVALVDHAPTFSLVSGQEMEKACFVALRSSACICALLFLALTTPLSSILQLLQRMGLNAEISDIAMVMFRIIWLLLDCLEAGQQSLCSRLGYTSNSRMLRSNGLLLASLLPRVFARARRMETGLAARGYTGRLSFISVERPASGVRLLIIGSGLAGALVFTWWLG